MLHADQLRSKMLCRYPTLLHWRLFLYSATWMTWFIHTTATCRSSLYRLDITGYLMLGGGTSTFRDRGTSAFRLLLHDTTFRFWPREVSWPEGSLAMMDVTITHPHAVIHDVSVCVSAWHLSFIEGSSGNEKFWHILTIYFFCGMNLPARGSLIGWNDHFPKKMGNVQIVQKMPVGWACNLFDECANWGSGSQSTANILKYPWPSVWYAYRYCILKCNYHCIHPKICKVLIHSYQTFISYKYIIKSISIQPGVQKQRHISLQEGKLIYHGLLLHEPLKLRPPHVELLMRLIRHGAWRHSDTVRDVNAFERSLDQDKNEMV